MLRATASAETAAPIVGRALELAAADAALARVEEKRDCACLAVAGSLGLGKSRLLGELELRAEARGGLVLAGRGSECPKAAGRRWRRGRARSRAARSPRRASANGPWRSWSAPARS
jgi:hypothetical protein